MEALYGNITKAILNVLNKIRKPLDSEEIAFRVRSTRSIVEEQLNKLAEAEVVKKKEDKYYIEDQSSSRNLDSIYNY